MSFNVDSNSKEEPAKRQVTFDLGDPLLQDFLDGYLSSTALHILKIVQSISLAGEECFAPNSYFRDVTGKKIETIRNEISRLVSSGYLIRKTAKTKVEESVGVDENGNTVFWYPFKEMRCLQIGSGSGKYRKQ